MVVRPSDSEARQLGALTGADPDWSPDGRCIAFSSGDEKSRRIAVACEDGLWRPRVLTQGSFVDASPAWSPDGREIAFARRSPIEPCSGQCPPQPAFEIHTMDADGTNVRRLTSREPTTNGGDREPVFSP
jgi:Tol biopolymer transport system component